MLPASRQSTLHGADGPTEASSRLLRGQALKIAEDQQSAVTLRKPDQLFVRNAGVVEHFRS
jgi:hypothetical protein